MANHCVVNDPSEERYKLVYEIEESYYGGKHPLTYDQHQKLTDEHKQLLEKYREETRADFQDLENESRALNSNDVYSEENLSKAHKFSQLVFRKSQNSSDGLRQFSRSIIKSCVDTLECIDISAPCNFAVIGLGSIAKGEATPYSDLEYGFIVEQESQYFQKLAVESYFRIGNLGETPLYYFVIGELEVNKIINYENTKVGFRIDGITSRGGNIPTGNGINRDKKLTLTVEGFMKLYKEAAEEPFCGLADKSDLLSSTVLIYTNEGQTSQLYESFLEAQRTYRHNEVANNSAVSKKRYDLFVSDIESFSFLPEFTNFDPPQNIDIQVKPDVFRYPTLLANNVKMCLGIESCSSWDTYSALLQHDILSPENYRYMNIVLALSIYLRTSAYLHEQSQTASITLKPDLGGTQKSHYKVSHDLFIILGCLLIPIKRSIKAFLLQHTTNEISLEHFVVSLSQSIEIAQEDLLPKVEVYYFCGQYKAALKHFGKLFGVNITKISFATLAEKIRQYYEALDTPQKPVIYNSSRSTGLQNKLLELYSYLLYYTGNYKQAVDCFSWLIDTQQHQKRLWKLLMAHCQQERINFKAARQLLDEVCRNLFSLDLCKRSQHSIDFQITFSTKSCSLRNQSRLKCIECLKQLRRL